MIAKSFFRGKSQCSCLFIYLHSEWVGKISTQPTATKKQKIKYLRWHTFEVPCIFLLQKQEGISQNMGILAVEISHNKWHTVLDKFLIHPIHTTSRSTSVTYSLSQHYKTITACSFAAWFSRRFYCTMSMHVRNFAQFRLLRLLFLNTSVEFQLLKIFLLKRRINLLIFLCSQVIN